MNVVPYRRPFGSPMSPSYMGDMQPSIHDGGSYAGYSNFGGSLYGDSLYGDSMYGGAGHGMYPRSPLLSSRYSRNPYPDGAYAGGLYDDYFDDGLYTGRL
jgi:hypothetical protein